MKKTLTILSLVLVSIISYNAKAQVEDKPPVKSYITILGGVSLPGGDFGKSGYYNNSSGYAKNGATFGLDGAYYFYKNLGIGVTFSWQDQGELNSNDAQDLSNGYNTSFDRDATTVTAVNRYHSYNLMGGPQYSFVIKKFTLDLRADAGVIKSASTPFIQVVFDNSANTNLTLNQLSSGGKAFAYGGSAALRWSFSDNWDVGFRANYVNSDGVNITNTNHTNDIGRLVTKQPITELQTTLGITLHL